MLFLQVTPLSPVPGVGAESLLLLSDSLLTLVHEDTIYWAPKWALRQAADRAADATKGGI